MMRTGESFFSPQGLAGVPGLPMFGMWLSFDKVCQGRLGIWIQKKGKLDISHRYNHIPLLPSGPGGVLQELVVYDLPDCKGKQNSNKNKFVCIIFVIL